MAFSRLCIHFASRISATDTASHRGSRVFFHRPAAQNCRVGRPTVVRSRTADNGAAEVNRRGKSKGRLLS